MNHILVEKKDQNIEYNIVDLLAKLKEVERSYRIVTVLSEPTYWIIIYE